MLTIEEELRMRAAHDAYARGMGLKVAKVLRSAFSSASKDLSAQSLSLSRRAELNAFMGRLGGTLGKAYQQMAQQNEADLRDLAKGQNTAMARRLNTIFGQQRQVLLTAERINAIVQLPVMDLPLGDWWRREARDMTERAKTTIRTGLLQGQPMRDIARALAGTKPTDRSAYRAALARSMTVTRTTASAVASATDRATFETLGSDITDRYTYRATLDTRTSTICAQTDGKVFAYKDPGALMPPLHPNCRSTTIPLLNTKHLTPEQRAKVERFYGTDGRTPPTRKMADYENWLRKQPPRVTKEILGNAEDAWRKGTVGLSDALASNRTAYTTYEQLAAALKKTIPPAPPTTTRPEVELGGRAAEYEALFQENNWGPHSGYKTLQELLTDHFAGIDGDKYSLLVSEFGEAVGGPSEMKFGVYLMDKETGGIAGEIRRVFHFDWGEDGLRKVRSVEHDLFHLREAYQGKGLAKQYLSKVIDQYKKLGVTEVHTFANIDRGAYAWARYGFVPNTISDWEDLLSDLRRRVSRVVEVADRDTVHELLDEAEMLGVDGVRMIADSKWGSALLNSQSWYGKLLLKDKTTMNRWNAYVAKAGK